MGFAAWTGLEGYLMLRISHVLAELLPTTEMIDVGGFKVTGVTSSWIGLRCKKSACVKLAYLPSLSKDRKGVIT